MLPAAPPIAIGARERLEIRHFPGPRAQDGLSGASAKQLVATGHADVTGSAGCGALPLGCRRAGEEGLHPGFSGRAASMPPSARHRLAYGPYGSAGPFCGEPPGPQTPPAPSSANTPRQAGVTAQPPPQHCTPLYRTPPPNTSPHSTTFHATAHCLRTKPLITRDPHPNA